MGFVELQDHYAERCPAIGLVGRTPLVRVTALSDELSRGRASPAPVVNAK